MTTVKLLSSILAKVGAGLVAAGLFLALPAGAGGTGCAEDQVIVWSGVDNAHTLCQTISDLVESELQIRAEEAYRSQANPNEGWNQ